MVPAAGAPSLPAWSGSSAWRGPRRGAAARPPIRPGTCRRERPDAASQRCRLADHAGSHPPAAHGPSARNLEHGSSRCQRKSGSPAGPGGRRMTGAGRGGTRAAGPRTVPERAATVGLPEDSAQRLLTALCAHGILERCPAGHRQRTRGGGAARVRPAQARSAGISGICARTPPLRAARLGHRRGSRRRPDRPAGWLWRRWRCTVSLIAANRRPAAGTAARLLRAASGAGGAPGREAGPSPRRAGWRQSPAGRPSWSRHSRPRTPPGPAAQPGAVEAPRRGPDARRGNNLVTARGPARPAAGSGPRRRGGSVACPSRFSP